ncbi:ATP-binding protein [Streptomyces racemochromogenes]|uniref:ATP-binding protein n=1 Tax=Streptomyces racemochromogenes TaxID=67353 RepID=UPI0031F0A73F
MNANALRQDWAGPAEGLTYRMVAPSRAEAVKVARDWVVAVLRSAGCGAEVGERARLCVSEVVTNAHRHTDSPEIAVEVALLGGRVTVYVYDCAPERWPDEGTRGVMATHGRGLALVAATADDWAAVAQGDCVKVVWFGFAVAAAGTG